MQSRLMELMRGHRHAAHVVGRRILHFLVYWTVSAASTAMVVQRARLGPARSIDLACTATPLFLLAGTTGTHIMV